MAKKQVAYNAESPEAVARLEAAYAVIVNHLRAGTKDKTLLENFKGTESRCVRALLETAKTDAHISSELEPLTRTNFPTHRNSVDGAGLVTQGPISIHSSCPHHLYPVRYVAFVSYIPKNGNVIGLSKLARICQTLGKRPVLQEQLASDIADVLFRNKSTDFKFPSIVSEGSGVHLIGSHGCFDGETELLTENGWVRFDKLKKGVQVAQVDVNKGMKMSFTLPTDYIQYPVKNLGMHYYNTQKTNLFMTPNHRVVYKTSWDYTNNPEKDWAIEEADKVPAEFYIPTKVDWVGGKTIGNRTFDGVEVSAQNYAALLGLYFSEGCNRGTRLEIVQKHNTKEARKIEKLISSLGFPYSTYLETQYNCKHWVIKSKELATHLLKYGRLCKHMRVPRYVQNAPLNEIQIFMDWYYLGDGDKWHLRNKTRKHNLVIHTASKKMARDLQLLYFKLGKYCTIQSYEDQTFETVTTGLGGMHYKVWQNIGKRREMDGLTAAFIRRVKSKIVNYTGDVYCVSVPTGAIVVRRNEKISVIGNCMSCRGVRENALTSTVELRGMYWEERMEEKFYSAIASIKSTQL